MHFRYLLSLLKTIRMPGFLPVMKDLIPFLRMHFLHAAFEAGLLQALETPRTKDELICRLSVQRPEILEALLDMGLAIKELRLKSNLYGLRGKRSKILASPANDALAAMIQGNVTYYNQSYRYLAERMQGAPLGNNLGEIGALVARFARVGEPILDSFIKSLVSPSGVFKVLDVGCGSGFVLKTAAGVNGAVTGIGVDMDDQVVVQAKDNIIQWGLEKRFEILSGDVRSHKEVLSGGFDLITIFNLVYYLPEEERSAFFTYLHGLLAVGGCLAVVNNFRSQGKDVMAANLNLVNASLSQLTVLPDLAVLEQQLADCGFKRVRTTRFIPKSEFYGIAAHQE
ncbi:class I SAM-dependent methyltransferase [Desulfobacterales bacterium HSG17]|nr:class I SAM-dependent methyltransferase [Desulfobacterales bacterium HSG17]